MTVAILDDYLDTLAQNSFWHPTSGCVTAGS
jgi:hypothetical protein